MLLASAFLYHLRVGLPGREQECRTAFRPLGDDALSGSEALEAVGRRCQPRTQFFEGRLGKDKELEQVVHGAVD